MTTFDTQDAADIAAYDDGKAMGTEWMNHPKTRSHRIEAVRAMSRNHQLDDVSGSLAVWHWAQTIFVAATGIKDDDNGAECLEWWQQAWDYQENPPHLLHGFMDAVTR